MRMRDVPSLRAGLDAFEAAVAARRFNHYAGHSSDLGLADVYDEHAHLASGDAVALVADARGHAEAAGDGEEARRLRLLHARLLDHRLQAAARGLTDAAAAAEAAAEVAWAGGRATFRESALAVATTDDRARRAAIYDARARALEFHVNPALRERWSRLHAAARDAGHGDYAQLYAAANGLELDALAKETEAFLRRTDALHREAWGALLEDRAGVPLERGEPHDAAWLLRGKAHDALFPRDRLVPALREALAGLGVDLDALEGVALDLEARPGKSPRAFVAPVRAPGDVRLSLAPRGGVDDATTLFHEAGHLVHYAHVAPGLPVEYRRLGDNSVTEAFAFLLQYLWSDPAFVAERARAREGAVAAHVRHQALVKLLYLRRYAGKLAYELRLHRRGLEGAGRAYRDHLERALGLRVSPAFHLHDVDDGLYSAQYLRAWMLEAALRRHLRREFGAKWWGNPQAGEALRELWGYGQKYDAPELAERLGLGALSMDAVAEELEAALADEE